MSRHDRHLPASRHLNKAVQVPPGTDPARLQRAAHGQGIRAKEDARDAKAQDIDDERK